MNNATFAGRAGQDAELRYTGQGTAVASFSLAVDTGKNNQGEKRQPLWVKVTIWEERAEKLAQYIKKGNFYVVDGPVRLDEWKDREGNTRSQINISARNLTFGGTNQGGSNSSQPSAATPNEAPARDSGPITDEDIPF